MELNIPLNLCNEEKEIVNANNVATVVGSGSVEVFATPAMIALMEKTANNSLRNYLPEDCVSVGVEINTKHIKASAIGKEIVCKSELIKVDGKKLFFNISAYEGEDMIGQASHTRVVVNKEKFLNNLK
ncbi:MAG: thioesterase family protein [Bacteroidales bacterium]|nr:thioesterase family protein [Bacteroidales bacterium]MEE1142644.1 thioesterase family protein [Bacteroidales bacterium]MEE1272802.1 thioesterase family protein [Bacteroidales bacterium]MEE1322301.1 thioesterase family protein [Bacteroidales bacterium]